MMSTLFLHSWLSPPAPFDLELYHLGRGEWQQEVMRNGEGMVVIVSILLVLLCWRCAHGWDGGKGNMGTGGNKV